MVKQKLLRKCPSDLPPIFPCTHHDSERLVPTIGLRDLEGTVDSQRHFAASNLLNFDSRRENPNVRLSGEILQRNCLSGTRERLLNRRSPVAPAPVVTSHLVDGGDGGQLSNACLENVSRQGPVTRGPVSEGSEAGWITAKYHKLFIICSAAGDGNFQRLLIPLIARHVCIGCLFRRLKSFERVILPTY